MASDRPPRDPLARAAREAETKAAPVERMFMHLRVHSAYSLLEGALPIAKIVGQPPRPKRRRSPSPTPTICSARSNSPRRRSRKGSSRSSAARSRSISGEREAIAG